MNVWVQLAVAEAQEPAALGAIVPADYRLGSRKPILGSQEKGVLVLSECTKCLATNAEELTVLHTSYEYASQ